MIMLFIGISDHLGMPQILCSPSFQKDVVLPHGYQFYLCKFKAAWNLDKLGFVIFGRGTK